MRSAEATGNAPSGTPRCCSPPGAARRRRWQLIRAVVQDATARGEGRAIGSRDYVDRGAVQRARPLRGGARRRQAGVRARGSGLCRLGPHRAGRGRRPERRARRRRRRPPTSRASAHAPAAPTGPSGSEARSAAPAQRRPGRGRVVPGGHRPARPHPRSPSTSPGPTWCTASGCGGRTGAATRANTSAPPTTCFTRYRRRGVRRARPPGAAGHRRVRRHRTVPRRATSSPPRRHRSPGWPGDGTHEPGDRRRAVHQPPDRRVAPAQGVHQARDQLPPRPLRSPRRGGCPAFSDYQCCR